MHYSDRPRHVRLDFPRALKKEMISLVSGDNLQLYNRAAVEFVRRFLTQHTWATFFLFRSNFNSFDTLHPLPSPRKERKGDLSRDVDVKEVLRDELVETVINRSPFSQLTPILCFLDPRH